MTDINFTTTLRMYNSLPWLDKRGKATVNIRQLKQKQFETLHICGIQATTDKM